MEPSSDASSSTNNSSSSSSTPINEPTIRIWELTEDSSHYDRMVAAPSDSDLVKFWSGWSAIMLFTGIVTTLILIPIVRRRSVRKNPFNLYLIFLMIPDMLVAWTCGLTCLSNAIAGHYISESMCKAQSWYMIGWIAASSWLNANIARQLYMMLRSASRFQKYQPPTRRRVVIESLGIYLYAMCLASLGMFNAEWLPHKTRLAVGAHCVPLDYSTGSSIFFFCVFTPLIFGIPLLYVCWAAYQIWSKNMLPPSGRRRILAVYFFRLAAVLLLMWLPGLLLFFVNFAFVNPWVQWAGAAWSHLQALVSALVSLLKPDIWKAVSEFWFCTTPATASDDDSYVSGRSIISMKSWGPSMKNLSSIAGMSSSTKTKKAPSMSKSGRTKKTYFSSNEYEEDLHSVGALVRALEAGKSSSLNISCNNEGGDDARPPLFINLPAEPLSMSLNSCDSEIVDDDDDDISLVADIEDVLG